MIEAKLSVATERKNAVYRGDGDFFAEISLKRNRTAAHQSRGVHSLKKRNNPLPVSGL